MINEYIFLLQLGDNLPDEYPMLASYFNRFNITLVPIRIQDLLDIKKDKDHFHVIVVCNDLKSRKRYLDLQKRILNFYLKSRRFHLHDISSFGQIALFPKIARYHVYNHYRLPDSYKAITYKISERYYQTGQQLLRWPGGKRAKLPV